MGGARLHKEFRPIRRYVISVRNRRRINMNIKQRSGNTDFKVWFRPSHCLYRCGHHLSFGCDEEELLTVSAPAWLDAAGYRNLPFVITGGKGPHIHLALTRLIRNISHPLPV